MTRLLPLLFGVSWMDPNWLFVHYKTEFLWVCLVIVFIECGLFFPFLPGDTLLFAVGLFIATGEQRARPPRHRPVRSRSLRFSVAAFLGNVVGYEIGRALGPPLYERDGRLLQAELPRPDA